MLYDQAQLADAYLRAFQASANSTYAEVARDIFRYVLRNLLDVRSGGFYSAEDADSKPTEDDLEKKGLLMVIFPAQNELHEHIAL